MYHVQHYDIDRLHTDNKKMVIERDVFKYSTYLKLTNCPCYKHHNIPARSITL